MITFRAIKQNPSLMKGALAHFKLEGLSTHKSAAAFISVMDRDPESRSQVSSFLRSDWLHL